MQSLALEMVDMEMFIKMSYHLLKIDLKKKKEEKRKVASNLVA